jgi:hypothetical protein
MNVGPVATRLHWRASVNLTCAFHTSGPSLVEFLTESHCFYTRTIGSQDTSHCFYADCWVSRYKSLFYCTSTIVFLSTTAHFGVLELLSSVTVIFYPVINNAGHWD